MKSCGVQNVVVDETNEVSYEVTVRRRLGALIEDHAGGITHHRKSDTDYRSPFAGSWSLMADHNPLITRLQPAASVGHAPRGTRT